MPLDSAGKLAVLIASLCAPWISYWLAQDCGLGAILGSALPSAVVAIFLHWQSHALPSGAAYMATAWFGAGFWGMAYPIVLARAIGCCPSWDSCSAFSGSLSSRR